MKKWLLVISIFLCGCGSSQKTLKVAATAVPHAEILEYIKGDLKQEGVNLKIVEIDDYNLPNRMLIEKQIDANFFQHKPFLEEQVRLHNYPLVSLVAVHIEPLGIYSVKFNSLDEIKNGSLIAIPQDPTNEARALMLLADSGLIKIKENENRHLITPLDIQENPKNLHFLELDAPFLPRALEDVDFAVIPANFALQAKKDPKKDALVLESSHSPYANIVAVRKGEENREELKKLKAVLTSDKIRKFIEEKFHGAIIPAF